MGPDSGFPQGASAHDNFWDFVSLSPETMHMLTWVMSDRTLAGRKIGVLITDGFDSFIALANAKALRHVTAASKKMRCAWISRRKTAPGLRLLTGNCKEMGTDSIRIPEGMLIPERHPS